MSIMTSAYRREIDGNDGWTNDITVTLHRAYIDEPIKVQVGCIPNASVHLDLPHARQLREALDEAIMLAEMAS